MRTRLRTLALGIVAVTAAALVLSTLPSTTTGANWTAPAPFASPNTGAGAAGAGAWCATPDPAAAATSGFVRLSTITETKTVGAATHHIAVVPVANVSSWNGGTSAKTLGVNLWSCQTALTGNLRVTSWSNPATALARTWVGGSPVDVVGPTSRLSIASGLGADLATKATNDSTTATMSSLLSTNGGGQARQYSWLVSSGRTAAAPAAVALAGLGTTTPTAQSSCGRVLSVTADSCTIALTTNGSSATGDAAITPFSWAATTGPTATAYTATTYAKQTTTGWATANATLNETCGILGALLCGVSAANVVMNVPSGGTAQIASVDGNLTQWVVIDWIGTLPPADVGVEIVLR